MLNERKFRKYKAAKKTARLEAGGEQRVELSRAVQLNAIERKRTAKLLRQRKGYESRKQWSVARELSPQGKGSVVRADRTNSLAIKPSKCVSILGKRG